MSHSSPTIEGFRAAFRRPSLTFGEIAWRWTVGAGAWTLFLFSFLEYLDTLPVTRGDRTLLGTRQPALVARAISHILRGSMNRAVLTIIVVAFALALLWVVAASVGRAAIVRALLDYFRGEVASNVPASAIENAGNVNDANGVQAENVNADVDAGRRKTSDSIPPGAFRSLANLNFLRVAVSLAAILALIGAAILTSFASPDAHPRPGLALILFLPFAAVIFLAWPTLNWFLSLAPIFVIRDGDDALDALSAAVTFSRERVGPVSAVSVWTGLAHLTALSIVGTAISLPLAFIPLVPSRLIVAVLILLMLAYFAVVDWLYMARLAGYICIAELPQVVTVSTAVPAGPAGQTPPTQQTAVDRDEPILSDLPNLIPGTSS